LHSECFPVEKEAKKAAKLARFEAKQDKKVAVDLEDACEIANSSRRLLLPQIPRKPRRRRKMLLKPRT